MTDRETVERLARELSALASREAQTMPPGGRDAHTLYSDSGEAVALVQEGAKGVGAIDLVTDAAALANTGRESANMVSLYSKKAAQRARAKEVQEKRK